MTIFDMRSPDGRPPLARPLPQSRGTYSIHPLPALGGVFAYVERNGEGVGLYFGETELAVTAAVADGVLADALDAGTGVEA